MSAEKSIVESRHAHLPSSTAIRTVKFFGWSSAWTEKVDAKRQEELSSMIRGRLNVSSMKRLALTLNASQNGSTST